jgi:hypothetical protein
MGPKEWFVEHCPKKDEAGHKCPSLGRGRMDRWHKEFWDSKNVATPAPVRQSSTPKADKPASTPRPVMVKENLPRG